MKLRYVSDNPDVQELYDMMTQGCFVVHWKDSIGGGSSVAAVGISESGRRWFAPTNWMSTGWLDEHIEQIERIELLAT